MAINDKRNRVVLGVVGHDIHVVANRILVVVLEESGFQVCNLRTNNHPEKFIDAAVETEANAILLSSLNGEAENWCPNFRARLKGADRNDTLLYVGGNLVTGEANPKEVEQRFLSWGFDRVFYGATDLNLVVKLLISDLKIGTTA